ncbi:MAG: PPC domain-containing protein [Pirellula sp.]|nr:PPC domain-containing protein [Pirellula sp.]
MMQIRITTVAWIWWLFSWAVISWAGTPSLEKITPVVGSRDQSFDVIALGSELQHVDQVVFYRPGLRCDGMEPVDNDRIKLRIVAHESCPLGSHPFRLASRFGISELRTLTISPFPTVNELRTQADQPQSIPLNTTVLGTLTKIENDDYEVSLTSGQRFSAEVCAVRLGIQLLDTEILLYAPDGRLICQVDDTPILNQDPCLSIQAPETGKYIVRVKSAGGPADADSPYALHVGDFPRPLSFYPLGGQAGSELEMTFMHPQELGFPNFTRRIELPDDLNASGFELNDGGASCPSPIPFRVVDFANATANVSSAADLPPSIAPIAFHGVIDGDDLPPQHSVQFSRPGKYRIEVFASRLGSPLDALLDVVDANGTVLDSGDDFESQDPRVIFDASTEQVVQLRVHDKRRKHGEYFFYRIEVEPLRSEPIAFLPRRDKQSQRMQTVQIPRGNRCLALLGVQHLRSQGSASVQWSGLPDSVTEVSIPQPDGTFLVPTILSAPENAQATVALASVVPVIGDQRGRFSQVVDLVYGPADSLFEAATLDRLAVAVVEPASYSVQVETPKNPLPIDGTLDIPFSIERTSGFEAPIDVSFAIPLEWVDCDAKVRVPEGQTSGVFQLRAGAKARPREWPLVLEAVAARESSDESIRVSSSLQKIRIIPSPVRGELSTLASEVGNRLIARCQWSAEGEIPNLLTATLEGLPNRVKCEPVSIRSDDRQFEFAIDIPEDAPTGKFQDIVVRLTGEMHGEHLSYCMARGTPLLLAPQGQLKTDADGRPLTPLEIVRSQKTTPVSQQP